MAYTTVFQYATDDSNKCFLVTLHHYIARQEYIDSVIVISDSEEGAKREGREFLRMIFHQPNSNEFYSKSKTIAKEMPLSVIKDASEFMLAGV